MSQATVNQLTSESFAPAVAEGVTVVDFWAPWCGPCMMLAPVLEELAEAVGPEVAVAKVNIDDHADLARQMGVSAIPTVLVFRDGAEVHRMIGLQSKSALLDAISAAR